MVSVTAAPRRIVQVTFDAGDSGVYDIPYSANFSRAVVQVVSANAGLDSIDLSASLTPAAAATHFYVGENIAGAVVAGPGQLTGPGVLFYTKGFAIPLVITYNINVAGAATVIIRMYDDNYQGTQTRTL